MEKWEKYRIFAVIINHINILYLMCNLLKYAYQGSEVTFSKGDNVMVNATQMAKAFGKQPNDWLKTEQAQRMIEAIAKTNIFGLADNQLVITIKGGNNPEERGTWMHEDVALVFAQWLSPEFYIWCNNRIKELIKNGVSDIRQTPQDYLSALKALVAKEEERLRLEADNKVLKPKADYFDDLVDRNLLTNFRDFAKELNVGQKYLIEWLISNRYIYRNEKGKIKPYSNYIEGDSRLFEVKEYKATNNSHSGTQTLITPRGRETFRLLIPRQQDLDI